MDIVNKFRKPYYILKQNQKKIKVSLPLFDG